MSLPSPRVPIIPPIPLLATAPVRLYLTAFSLLFTELALIRWIPAEITYVGFFSNFLLMGSFLGIGIGILAGRRSPTATGRWLPIGIFIPLLFVTVRFITAAQLNVQLRATNEVFFGLAENRGAADINFVVLPLAVGLATLVMAVLAMPLGPLLRAMPPLRAYSVDILGSLTGIAAFALLAAWSTSPAAWFLVLGIVLFGLALGRGITMWGSVSAALMLGVIVVSGAPRVEGAREYWSPYYRVTQVAVPDDPFGARTILVNGIPHQTVWDLNDPRKEPFYDQVYRWLPDRTFDNVLVVGAGNGVDVATALAHGAGHVDAVEIDPLIAELGRAENRQQPYSDPRVDLYINDGRNFLSTSDTRYDLVVFALPDSLTLVSSAANIRLESFLFTREAFSEVRDHLSDAGVFVLYNYYRQPWLVERLTSMVADVFGSQPLVQTYRDVSAAIGAGPGIDAARASQPNAASSVPAPGDPGYRAATDDWPFLYLRDPSIAPYYIAALLAILLFGTVLVAAVARATRTPLRRFSPHFFVLGAAFLLIETRSVVTFSLLFGSTWLVNALVFFAILVSVLAAIQVNARFKLTHVAPIYLLLIGTLAVNAVLPPETLLSGSPAVRYVAASLLAFVPIFCANLVFTRSFRDTRTADMSFASNLLGAVVGGGLEYLSLVLGYSALNVVAILLYSLAWLLMTRVRVLADVELA
jgi:hypothetical protein